MVASSRGREQHVTISATAMLMTNLEPQGVQLCPLFHAEVDGRKLPVAQGLVSIEERYLPCTRENERIPIWFVTFDADQPVTVVLETSRDGSASSVILIGSIQEGGIEVCPSRYRSAGFIPRSEENRRTPSGRRASRILAARLWRDANLPLVVLWAANAAGGLRDVAFANITLVSRLLQFNVPNVRIGPYVSAEVIAPFTFPQSLV